MHVTWSFYLNCLHFRSLSRKSCTCFLSIELFKKSICLDSRDNLLPAYKNLDFVHFFWHNFGRLAGDRSVVFLTPYSPRFQATQTSDPWILYSTPRYYIPVCVGGEGVALRASIHPIFFPTCALLPSYHRSSLSSHHSSTSDRPTDRCFDKVSDSPFTKRHADRPTGQRNAFLDIDSWTKSAANRSTDRRLVQW